MAQPDVLEESRKSLKRVQDYDVGSFDRVEELGTSLNLSEAMAPARRVIELFQRLPIEMLAEFPEQDLNKILQQANSVYKTFEELEEFSSTSVDNPSARKAQLIDSVKRLYDSVFPALFPYISFSAARTADFQRLEREGRAAVQAISDRTNELTTQLAAAKSEADGIISDVRKVAAEQGVSQQAIYFKEESEYHSGEAEKWKIAVFWLTGGLLLYGLASLHFHLVPWLTPQNSFEAYQLIAGKVLIFAVLAFLLFLAARNFLSHKHNAITNKHRQNALVTFKALVDAGGTKESRDTVLKYAAASVFTPQDTGMVRQPSGVGSNSNTLIEVGAQQLADQ